MSGSLRPHGLYSPWNSPGQNTGVGSLSLLQGVCPTQGSNPGLQHCRQNLYQLSHKGNPRILERAAFPFSRGSAQPRDQTQVSCIVGGFFYPQSHKGSLFPGSIPGSGRSPGEGNGNPLQCSCLENSADRGSWWATVQRVARD